MVEKEYVLVVVGEMTTGTSGKDYKLIGEYSTQEELKEAMEKVKNYINEKDLISLKKIQIYP